MANIFSTNQVNHAYVVSEVNSAKPVKSDKKGSTYVGKTKDGSIYFMQRGAAGIVRSDIIDIKNIMYVNYTPAVKMNRPRKAAEIFINASCGPIIGQDYVLCLEFVHPMGISPDNKYFKHAVVHFTSDMDTDGFYIALVKSLLKNLKVGESKLLNIYVGGSLIETAAQAEALSNINGIVLVEPDTNWEPGTVQEKSLDFTVNFTPALVSNEGNNVNAYWGDVVYSNGTWKMGGEDPYYEPVQSGDLDDIDAVAIPFNNSKVAFDLEYFSMGDRADRYRNVGWPDVIHTEYLVDPNFQYGYDMINIHYFYNGSNHAVQKSEKDITLIVPSDKDAEGGLGTVATELKAAIEAAVNPTDSRYVQMPAASGVPTGDSAAYWHRSGDTITLEASGE